MEYPEACIALESLYEKIRTTNVRSQGVKVVNHERWCSELERLCSAFRGFQEAGRIAPSAPLETASKAQ